MLAVAFVSEALRSAVRAVPALAYLSGLAVIGAGCVVAARRARGRISMCSQIRRASGLTLTMLAIDEMAPRAFEEAIRDLMLRDGVSARHVGAAGDKVADVIGTDVEGAVYVAQCKHTTVGGKVGVRVIYEVNGTARPVHGADTALVVTNGTFTRDARGQAKDFAIYLIDREALHLWAGGVHIRTLIKHAASAGRRRQPTSVPRF
ncbi:restriction endonuclease [Actinospica sp. MGRD01-02]|uniref:Restriction endonuclease n=1 Tax=Actinospica acidithermotolerans TaxID=2828514 RepID=A0A941EE01_9ACTN|nr:restriction endonuclease [Actinospica acidithermotolerans]MBR7828693.1 restriction endonuclease [Actinospica acidithermotolerans]